MFLIDVRRYFSPVASKSELYFAFKRNQTRNDARFAPIWIYAKSVMYRDKICSHDVTQICCWGRDSESALLWSRKLGLKPKSGHKSRAQHAVIAATRTTSLKSVPTSKIPSIPLRRLDFAAVSTQVTSDDV